MEARPQAGIEVGPIGGVGPELGQQISLGPVQPVVPVLHVRTVRGRCDGRG